MRESNQAIVTADRGSKECRVRKGPEKEPNGRREESGSEPVEWQKNDGGEERPREGHDVETDTQGEPEGSRP